MVMKSISLDGQVVTCQNGETVLDALLREHIDVPNACRQGACQSCMMRSLDVEPPELSQRGLKDVLRQQKHFLACMCYPEKNMSVTLSRQSEFFTEGTVIGKELLNQETLLLTIQCQEALDFYAGQFVNLRRADGLVRSYSIANSRFHANKLTFHIRRLAGGRFSEWVHQELKVGDTLEVSDPQGLCYYLPDNKTQNMLLIGTGSGLAPLAGIVSEALHHGHSGAIHLLHGSREMDGLYWIEEMQQMANEYPNFHYIPCVSRGDAPEGVAKGRANVVAMAELPELKGWRVFLCGHPDMVNQTKRQAYLNGASLQDIYSDAFHVASASLD
ncbi:MAG: 2Fe-2S iron-sulfur cluster-binding protein [Gammaproteobacteria bacterium]